MTFHKIFKPAYRYQLRELLPSVGVFYLIILCVYLLASGLFNTTIMGTSSPDGAMTVTVVSTSGVEIASMIFLFVLGLNSFKPQFLFFMANTRSRRLFFVSRAAALLSLDLLMALIDTLAGLIMGSFSSQYLPAYLQLYQHRFAESFASFTAAQLVTYFGECLLWYTALYALFTSVGFAITILYYRMNKLAKYLVSWSVPILLLILLPILDYQLLDNRISQWTSRILAAVTGLQGTPNPFIFVCSAAVGTLLVAAVSWLMVRRAAVKG